MNVLLSMKPEYVKKILSGEKKYEFRKRIWKKDVDRVFIYATSPVKRIVALFKPGEIIKDIPSGLWVKYNQYSGLNEIDFFNYFHDKDYGYAIKITDLKEFNDPIEPKSLLNNFTAPQSFQYYLHNPDSKIIKKNMVE